MTYLETPAEHELYQADLASTGYIANYTRLFALRPNVYAAWQQLSGAVKSGMDLRRYELVTLAAARQLRSSYCSLAHGKILRDKFYDADSVATIAAGEHELDAAIMAFAAKVARGASTVTEADIDVLRGHGLSDEDIFQVILAVGVRCFFSTVLDAAGAQPDAEYRSLIEPALQQVLTVGRPIATAE